MDFLFFRNCKILVGILQLSAALAQLATTVSFLNSMLNQYLTSGDFVRISQFDCCTKPFLFTSFFPSFSFLHLLLFLSLSLSPSVYVCLDDKHKNGLYANDIFETIDQHPKMGWNLYHERVMFVCLFFCCWNFVVSSPIEGFHKFASCAFQLNHFSWKC